VCFKDNVTQQWCGEKKIVRFSDSVTQQLCVEKKIHFQSSAAGLLLFTVCIIQNSV